MNFANYSPYNKSYKFILFQNQAYHQKNKRIASPCVKTNIRFSLNKSSSNPQYFTQRYSQSSKQRSRINSSQILQNSELSNSMLKSSSFNNVILNGQKRVIHKNESYQKFRAKKINVQNTQIAGRLIRTSCQVIDKKSTEKSFNNHLKYRQIRKKYTDQGTRKTKMHLGNSVLLCPTLAEYNQSGLSQKFIQLDLSMSRTPSTGVSKMRKRRSQIQFQKQILNQA